MTLTVMEPKASVGRKAVLPDKDVLERMVRAGLTHKQIAEQFGVTRQAVGKRMQSENPDNHWGQLSAHMPWLSVSAVHQRTYVYRSLQCLVRRRLGIQMSPEQENQLDTFLAELDSRSVVVSYDSSKGWVLVPRANRPGLPDDTYMV